MALYGEIQDELDDLKDGVVEQWLQASEPLAGGYGRGLVAWRGRREVTMFKDRCAMIRAVADSSAIRSNGHAWCTADDHRCLGNGGLEGLRCTDLHPCGHRSGACPYLPRNVRSSEGTDGV